MKHFLSFCPRLSLRFGFCLSFHLFSHFESSMTTDEWMYDCTLKHCFVGMICILSVLFQDLILDQTIEKVSFCAPDRNFEHAFSYICRDGTTRRWICHCFMAFKDSVRCSCLSWTHCGPAVERLVTLFFIVASLYTIVFGRTTSHLSNAF